MKKPVVLMRVEVERGQLTVFSYQFSVIGFQLSVVKSLNY